MLDRLSVFDSQQAVALRNRVPMSLFCSRLAAWLIKVILYLIFGYTVIIRACLPSRLYHDIIRLI